MVPHFPHLGSASVLATICNSVPASALAFLADLPADLCHCAQHLTPYGQQGRQPRGKQTDRIIGKNAIPHIWEILKNPIDHLRSKSVFIFVIQICILCIVYEQQINDSLTDKLTKLTLWERWPGVLQWSPQVFKRTGRIFITIYLDYRVH